MDAVVVGRNTYELFKTNLQKRNTIVFSSRISQPNTFGRALFFNPQKSNFKELIKSKNYKKIAVLGGPKVYNYFIERKMLNELFVTIEPFVFTAGVPMFSGSKFRKYNFILKSFKKLNNRGTILLRYKCE